MLTCRDPWDGPRSRRGGRSLSVNDGAATRQAGSGRRRGCGCGCGHEGSLVPGKASSLSVGLKLIPSFGSSGSHGIWRLLCQYVVLYAVRTTNRLVTRITKLGSLKSSRSITAITPLGVPVAAANNNDSSRVTGHRLLAVLRSRVEYSTPLYVVLHSSTLQFVLTGDQGTRGGASPIPLGE